MVPEGKGFSFETRPSGAEDGGEEGSARNMETETAAKGPGWNETTQTKK